MNRDYRLSEKSRQHGDSSYCKIMLATQPSSDFIRTFTECFRKLLFILALFPHQGIQSVGNSKGQTAFLTFFAGNFVKKVLQGDIGCSHNSKFLSVIISFSVISTLPEWTFQIRSYHLTETELCTWCSFHCY